MTMTRSLAGLNEISDPLNGVVHYQGAAHIKLCSAFEFHIAIFFVTLEKVNLSIVNTHN